MSNSPSVLAGGSNGISVPSTAVKGLKAKGSSLIVSAAGGSEEALGGHRGLIKNSRGSGYDVSSIPAGIMGLLLHISCTKAQQLIRAIIG